MTDICRKSDVFPLVKAMANNRDPNTLYADLSHTNRDCTEEALLVYHKRKSHHSAGRKGLVSQLQRHLEGPIHGSLALNAPPQFSIFCKRHPRLPGFG